MWKKHALEHCHILNIRFNGFTHKKIEYLDYSAWISMEEGMPEGTDG